MKVRRLFALLLAAAMALCLPVTAGAAEAAQANRPLQLSAREVEYYAYMDIREAPAALHDTILAARDRIIYGDICWVSDDGDGWVTNPDGTVEEVPHFSEVFPEDWEIPVDPAFRDQPEEAEAVAPEAANLMASHVLWGDPGLVWLKKPKNGVNTAPFITGSNLSGNLTTEVLGLITSESCNIGYTNLRTNTSLAYYPRRTVGATCTYTLQDGTNVGVRASTYGTPGYGRFYVTFG